MDNYLSIPMRLAAAFIQKHGEISFREIRSLPLVESDECAIKIANELAQHFEVANFERAISQSGFQIDNSVRIVKPAIKNRRNPNTTNSEMENLPEAPVNLAKSIRKKFAPLGGVELDLVRQ